MADWDKTTGAEDTNTDVTGSDDDGYVLLAVVLAGELMPLVAFAVADDAAAFAAVSTFVVRYTMSVPTFVPRYIRMP